ncbi:MAG: hypothetical protein ABJZ74_16505 [Nitratireductor sp.]
MRKPPRAHKNQNQFENNRQDSRKPGIAVAPNLPCRNHDRKTDWQLSAISPRLTADGKDRWSVIEDFRDRKWFLSSFLRSQRSSRKADDAGARF